MQNPTAPEITQPEVALRPQTLGAMQAFARRRRDLLLARAALFFLAALVLGATLIALADRLRWIPEALRPWLSLSLELGLLLWAGFKVLQPLRQSRNLVGLASLIEAVYPGVRQSLVAAVELGHPAGTGSTELRAALQERVARELQGMSLPVVLPLRALRQWGQRLALLGLLVALLSLVPGLHLPGFLQRALLPFANLPRPSSLQIVRLVPEAQEAAAPIGSEQEVVVELRTLDGVPLKDLPQVWMDWKVPGGQPRRQAMKMAGGGRCSASLLVGQQDVEFRVEAADAITAWWRFVALPRPGVTEWVMAIEPPAYSGLAVENKRAASADLEVLEGSVVHLQPKLNQAVSEAKLQLNPDHAKPLPDVQGSINGDQVSADLPVRKEIESWRLWLRSRQTGWTNEESTPFRLTVLPDLPPSVKIEQPAEEVVEMLPDETLRLSLAAGDDVGLLKTGLSYQINAGPWVSLELGAARPGKQVSLAHVMPLGPLQLKAADSLAIKATATDLKGQSGESSVVRVVILEQTLSPEQRQWVELTTRLALSAQSLSEQSQDLSRSLQKWRREDMQTTRPEAQRRAAQDTMVRAQDALEKSAAGLKELWDQVAQSARQAPAQGEASEAALLGQRLAQMRSEFLPTLQAQLKDPSTANSEVLRKAASALHSQAQNVAQAARSFALEDQARVGAQQAAAMARQQALLTEQSLEANRDASKRPKWQEQQRAALGAVGPLQQRLEQLQLVADSSSQNQAREAAKQVGEAVVDLNESLDSAQQSKSPEHLYGASDNLRQRLQRHAEGLRRMADSAAQRSAQQREQLGRSGNPALAALAQANDALRQWQQENRKPNAKPRLDREGKNAAQRAGESLKQAQQQLQSQAELRDARMTAAQQGGLDLNRSSRAAGRLAQEVAASPAAEAAALAQRAEMLERATRILAAEAQAQDAQQAAQSALARGAEDPGATQPEVMQQEASAELRSAAESLRQVAETLRRQKEQQALVASTSKAAALGQSAAEKWKQLAARPKDQVPAQDPQMQQAREGTGEAAAAVAQVLDGLQEQAAEARDFVGDLAPKVSEMMRQAAADLQQSKQAAEAAAAKAGAQNQPTQVAAEAMELGRKAQQQDEKLQSLQAALRQEANAADWNKQSQRQMSRTADAALAQLQKTGPQVQQALQSAVQSEEAAKQAASLGQAAEAQGQAAEALEALAKNMAKAESGAELSDAELAQAAGLEEQLEVKQPLDEAYARAQALAQMAADASKDPAKVLGELEKELGRNPAMKKSLAQIGGQMARDSEAAVASEAQQPSNLGLATDQAASDLQRVARHQGRLGMEAQAQEVSKAAAELQRAAQAAAPQPPKPGVSQPPPAPVPIGSPALDPAGRAAKAAQSTEQAVADPPLMHPMQRLASAMLAQALDQLDAQVYPKTSAMPQAQQQGGANQQASKSGQQGQQGQQGQKGNQASQSLASAQQSQQQQMADQRNQGQAPGSSAAAANSPNQGKPQQQGKMASNSAEGGNLEAAGRDGQLVLEKILMGGDWGRLPGKMAQGLQEATRSEAAAEYRAAIESYYRAIAGQSR